MNLTSTPKKKNKETVNQQLNKLFSKWKEKRHYDDSVFVSDGLVYKNAPWKMEKEEELAGTKTDVEIDKLWKESPLRIVFLLKDTPDTWGDDIRQWMILDTKESAQCRNLSGGRVGRTGFLPNIAKILFGIRYIKELKYDNFEDFKKKYTERIVKSWSKLPFAFVETKKIAGNPNVSIKEIQEFLKNDGEFLMQELDYLQPNVIICTCDPQFDFITTKYLANEVIDESDKKVYKYPYDPYFECCLWYYHERNTAVVKSYHPTNRGKIQWTIFERVVSPFRKLLKEKPQFFEKL
ncbi:MAG: hypothetical protein IKI25_06010 [Bacteroidales bacterium]|nr:hypothetical protein [Bacteroidales bacterium]